MCASDSTVTLLRFCRMPECSGIGVTNPPARTHASATGRAISNRVRPEAPISASSSALSSTTITSTSRAFPTMSNGSPNTQEVITSISSLSFFLFSFWLVLMNWMSKLVTRYLSDGIQSLSTFAMIVHLRREWTPERRIFTVWSISGSGWLPAPICNRFSRVIWQNDEYIQLILNWCMSVTIDMNW